MKTVPDPPMFTATMSVVPCWSMEMVGTPARVLVEVAVSTTAPALNAGEAIEYVTANVGFTVSMTMFLLSPRDPLVPGLANVRRAVFPARSEMVPPFASRADAEK